MKFPPYIELSCSILVLATIGCGARPSKPVPTLAANSISSKGSDSSGLDKASSDKTSSDTVSIDQKSGNNASDSNASDSNASDSNASDNNASGNNASGRQPVEVATPSPQSQPSAPAKQTPASTSPTASSPGNQPAPQPKPSVSAPAAKRAAEPIVPVRDDVSSTTWLADSKQLPIEYWDVQYFNAQRIGITHYKMEAAGKDQLAILIETSMQIQRSGQAVRQNIVIETREQPNGQLIQFSETITSGAAVSKTVGQVNSKEMTLQKDNADRNSRKLVPWPSGSWGPLGIHQLLLRKPMQPGEARQANVFMSQMHKMALVTLVAGQKENATTLNGLLTDVVPIDVLMQIENDGIRVRMWADSMGRVQKTIWPEGLNLSSFRVSGEIAKRLQSEDEITADLNTFLASEKLSIDPTKASQVQYEISGDLADSINLFSQSTNQKAKSKFVYDVVVTVVRPEWQGAVPLDTKQPQPSSAEQDSSLLLPSSSPLVDRLAKQWTGPATDPVDMARALLEATHQRLRKLDFAASVQPVETVAQNLEGDCTEHAMLLAALLRNRHIPARIASGIRLRDRDGQTKFEYHMWTEAWLNNKWVPMDATTGQLTSCAYLKFVDTSLADGDPYGPVLTVLKKLKHLRVVSAN